MIGSIESGTSMKMIKNLSEKLAAIFPATTLSCSIVKIACLTLSEAFSESFELEASLVEAQSRQKIEEERKAF